MTTPVTQDPPTTSGLTAGIDLPLSLEAAYLARRAVADVLSGWRVGNQELLNDARLVTSELVTNAVRHGGQQVRLELRLEADALRVAVSDGSAALPTPRISQENDEMGRGLMILTAITDAWGVENAPDGGKQVWARLPLTSSQPAQAGTATPK